MARSDRLHITVSPEMTVALEVLSERTGLTVSTQAMVVLRQALDRTIGSTECMERLAKRKSFTTAAQWREDAAAERFVSNRMPVKRDVRGNGKPHAVQG